MQFRDLSPLLHRLDELEREGLVDRGLNKMRDAVVWQFPSGKQLFIAGEFSDYQVELWRTDGTIAFVTNAPGAMMQRIESELWPRIQVRFCDMYMEDTSPIFQWLRQNRVDHWEADGDGHHPAYYGEALVPVPLYKEWVELLKAHS